MENLGIYDILENIREDEQQLERLVANLKKEKKLSTIKHPDPTSTSANST